MRAPRSDTYRSRPAASACTRSSVKATRPAQSRTVPPEHGGPPLPRWTSQCFSHHETTLQPLVRCHLAASTAPAPSATPSYVSPMGWFCLISPAWLLPPAADVGSLRVWNSRWAHGKVGGSCRPTHFQAGSASKSVHSNCMKQDLRASGGRSTF